MGMFKKIFSKIDNVFDKLWNKVSDKVWDKLAYRLERMIRDQISDNIREIKGKFIPKDKFETVKSMVEDIKAKTIDKIKSPRLTARRKKPSDSN